MLESLVRRFLYYPTKLAPDAPLPRVARSAREVWLRTDEELRIHGLYWPAPPRRPTILFLHGNAQSVYEWAFVRLDLAPLDAGLLLIDYPGYGKSSGTPTERGLYAAGVTALRWLDQSEGIAPERVVVHGTSLGGGVASEICRGRPLGGVILESTFRSIPHVAQRLFPLLPARTIFRSERFDTAARIAELAAPLLIVHGTADQLVPCLEGEALYALAPEPKDLYLVEGAGHNDVSLVAGSAYGKRLRQWLDGTKAG